MKDEKDKVKVIPAADRNKKLSEAALRVAAYCRVSTDHSDQEMSYAAQQAYYRNLINEKPNWTFAGIYADKARTGTTRSRRIEFNRMIADAKAGKIDYIITKSISRFARNTVDSLYCIRELRQLSPSVGVFFEKENIDSLDSKGELILTIYSALAQEESRSISDNLHWTVQKKFEAGIPMVNLERMIGYDKGPNGEWIINEEQAETVRYIFERYLYGKSGTEIARELIAMGRKTAWGKDFKENSILRVLTNEKLVGDLELQKYIMKDFLQHTARPNRGEAPKYYVRDHHEGIVDRTTWEMVQVLMRKDRCGWNRVYGETAGWEQYQVGKKVVNRVDRRSGSLGNPFICIHCKGGCGADIRYRVAHRGRTAKNYVPDPKPEGPYEAVQTYTCLVCEGCRRTRCRTGYLYSDVLEQEYMRLLYRLKEDYRKNGSQSELETAWRAVLKERLEHKEWYEAHEEKRRVLESELAKLETAKELMEDKKHWNGTEFAKQRTTELIQGLSEGSISFDDLEVRVEYGINCIVLKDEAKGSKGQSGDQILVMTEELLTDIEKRIAEKRQQLRELEDGCLREDFMKKYYELFLKYLLLLPDTQPDGTAIDPQRQMLPFERGMFTAFILDGELDGDCICYRTRFGVEFVCKGAGATLEELIGQIRFREDGSSVEMKEAWQIKDELPKIRKKRRWSQADIEKYGKETNE